MSHNEYNVPTMTSFIHIFSCVRVVMLTMDTVQYIHLCESMGTVHVHCHFVYDSTLYIYYELPHAISQIPVLKPILTIFGCALSIWVSNHYSSLKSIK